MQHKNFEAAFCLMFTLATVLAQDLLMQVADAWMALMVMGVVRTYVSFPVGIASDDLLPHHLWASMRSSRLLFHMTFFKPSALSITFGLPVTVIDLSSRLQEPYVVQRHHVRVKLGRRSKRNHYTRSNSLSPQGHYIVASRGDEV